MDNIRNSAILRELTPRSALVFAFMSIGALNFGFDNGWWSSVISLPQFADYYGPEERNKKKKKTLPSSWLSAGSGTATAGIVIGCLVAGAIGRKIGRRWTIVLLVGIAVVGMVVQNAVGSSFWGVMVGRMVNAVSMGIEANVIPMYMAELSPPAIRGSVVNFYQWWQIMGVLISNGIVLGTRSFQSRWAFQTVMVAQFFLPLVLLAAVWVLPESPRWLLLKDRREDARKSLAFIRKGAATAEEVEQELDLLHEANDEQERLHKATSYVDCLKGSNGRRTLIAASVQVLQQLQGNSFMVSYGVLYLEQMGVKDPLKGQMANLSMALAGTTLAFILVDKLGRRFLFLSTAALAWALMWISSGLSSFLPAGASAGAVGKVNLFCIMIWYCLQTLGWGSCVWITTSEVATSQLRERTISIATSLSFIAVLLVNYINPFVQYEPGNLGSKVGFVYGSFSVVAFVWVYLMVPELKGRSLEELDELFQSKVSARKFKQLQCAGIGAKITQIQDINAGVHEHVIDGVAVGDGESAGTPSITVAPKE